MLELLVLVAGINAGIAWWWRGVLAERAAEAELARVIRLVNRHALNHRDSKAFVMALGTLRARIETGDEGMEPPIPREPTED